MPPKNRQDVKLNAKSAIPAIPVFSFTASTASNQLAVVHPIRVPLLFPKIREIVSCVIQHLKLPDQVAAARVCAAWWDVALDQIWCDLPGLRPLLALLGPLELGSPIAMSVSAPVGDWERFHLHAKRVRCLTHSGSDSISPDLLVLLFSRITSAPDPPSGLLPGLRQVSWSPSQHAAVSQLVPFLAPSVEILDINISGMPYIVRKPLLRTLAGLRGLRLKGLTCRFKNDGPSACDAFKTFLINQSATLTRLSILANLQTGEMSLILPKLNRIQHLQLELEGAYPWVLSQFCNLLASSCPSINALELRLKFGTPWLWGEALPFFSLNGLVKCAEMKDLCLDLSPQALMMDFLTIQEMGRAWPRLRTLRLSSTRLSLSTLVSFSKSFPSLQSLDVPFYVDQQQLPRVDAVQTRFTALKYLFLETMTISDDCIPTVGEFLGSICTDTTQFRVQKETELMKWVSLVRRVRVATLAQQRSNGSLTLMSSQ